jgi:Carboxypeptidase regulatory-like domain
MRRRIVTTLLLRVALVLTCGLTIQICLCGQNVPEPRTLSGTLYYVGSSQPAEGITVELHTSEGNLIAPQTTSSTGWFEFRGLPRGTYIIEINTSGFEPVSVIVDLALSSSRGNVMYLRARGSAKPQGANSTQ